MHTSLSKKLLAGLLSLVMVLSLVAPSTSAQAATKYSLTDKKSVKSGVTFKYELKGVSKGCYVKVTRNVSGEKVVYKKKELTKTTKINGTGKTLNLYVTYGEKDENYTGKFTVKVYGKKTNKLYKTLVEKVTVKVPEKEAVTSVAINNTTPKVGDTLSVVATPENASIVSYEWKAGSDVVGKAATYTVTTAELGKTITVTVTDALGNVKTSEATAAVTDTALEVVSAEQTGANTVKVVMNKAITSDDVVSLTKGTEAQKVTAVLDETDNKTITITTSDKIVTTTYTVKVTPKDTAVKEASKEFKGAAQELKGLKFGNELALASASNFYKAYAKLSGVDQWGDEYGVPAGKVTVYASTATAATEQKYDATTQTVTVAKKTDGSQLPFTLGEKVTLTAIYKSGSTVIQQTGEVVVSNAAYVSEMNFGELATTKAAFKDKKVTLERFYNGAYYLPVVAKDQYGNVMSAEQLQDAVDPANTNLFVTPTAAQCVYAGFDKFDTLDDGTVVMFVNSKATAMPGKAVINISALGGYSTQVAFEVFDNPYIDTLTFEVPGSLYAGERAELNVSAVDQYGDAVDLYEMFDANTATALTFKDKNGISSTSTKVTASVGNFSVVKNAKKVKFYYTPAGDANSSVTFTVQTASNKVDTQTLTIGAAGTVSKIASFKSSVNKNTAPTNKTYDIESAVVFEDSNGNKVDYTSSKFPTFNETITATSGTTAGQWNVFTDKACRTAATVTNGILTVTGSNGADVTYYVGLTTDDTAGVDQVKQFTVHIANPKVASSGDDAGVYESYRAEIKNGKTLLQNVEGADSATVLVYGTDKDGCEVLLTPQDSTKTVAAKTADYTMTVSDGFNQAENLNKIIPATGAAVAANAKEAVTGKCTATIWTTAGTEATTVSIDYSNAPSVATDYWWGYGIYFDSMHTVYGNAGDEITPCATAKIAIEDGQVIVYNTDDGNAMNARGEMEYYLEIDDQYGNAMEDAVVVYNGVKTATLSASALTNEGANTVSVNAGTIIKTVTINK